MNGKTKIIIRGEGAVGVSVYSEYITLEADRASNDSITVQLKLNGLEGSRTPMLPPT